MAAVAAPPALKMLSEKFPGYVLATDDSTAKVFSLICQACQTLLYGISCYIFSNCVLSTSAIIFNLVLSVQRQ